MTPEGGQGQIMGPLEATGRSLEDSILHTEMGDGWTLF